jgi:hypothetical protein
MIAVLFLAVIPVSGQPAPQPHRMPDGKPDLNGIWQALNTANWDLAEHAARTGLVVAMGAIGAEPGGSGVVEGGEIPYLPAAKEKKKANFESRLTPTPEVKCYLPGVPRATYLPYPFQIFHSEKAIFFAYEYAGAVRNIFLEDPGPRPPIPGWDSRSATGKGTRWWSTLRAWMSARGSTGPGISIATRCT